MKVFLSAAFIFLLQFSVAAQVKFTAFLGPQATTAKYEIGGVKQKTSTKIGFQIGMGMKVPFETRLYFAPALYYSMKGYKVKYTGFAYPPDVTATDNNTTFHNVETAFLLQYDFSDQPNHFFIKLGPSLDFQIFGKEKFNTPTEVIDRNIPFGYDKYGHYSANMILQLGYEMSNGFFIQGQYSHGLSNINNADLGPDIRHRVYGITVGKFLK